MLTGEGTPRKAPKRSGARATSAKAFTDVDDAGEDASERNTFASEERSPSPSPRHSGANKSLRVRSDCILLQQSAASLAR